MSDSSSLMLSELVHEALAARVRLLLGQSTFTELLDTQDRVSQALAHGGALCHAPAGGDGGALLTQSVLQALELDPAYYVSSDVDFIVAEGLTSAGVVLAELVRGHEGDSRARWQAEVVPALDRAAAFVAGVFDGRWARGADRLTLSQWMALRPS